MNCPARSFQSELELVEKFTKRYLTQDSSQYSRFLTEFECSHGRADVVQFNLRKNWSQLLALGQIKPHWSYALRAIPYRKRFTTEAFASLAGVSIAYARRALTSFEKADFCVKATQKGHWFKIKQPQPIANQITSYEAKIRDWRRALMQAYRYKEYSDVSWVVMDDYFIGPALRHISQFQKYNIGLASLNVDGDLQVHFRPVKEPPRSELNSWTANSMIAASLTNQQ